MTNNAAPEREYGFPFSIKEPLSLFERDTSLKAHPAYPLAKAGSQEAAVKLIMDLAHDFLLNIKVQLPKNSIYIAPFAKEATGDNAIPLVLAMACAIIAGGECDQGIVQISRVYHTGADPMERLISRPQFEGIVKPDGNYVLVDDVTSMGRTLADLANFIQKHGGKIAHVVVLVNAGRNKSLRPDNALLQTLHRRYEHEIRSIFGIHTTALTANEARYLIGFRHADEIRNRCAKAKEETNLRLCAKGIDRTV